LRSLRGEAHQGPHSSVFVRLASGAFYDAIRPIIFMFEIVLIEIDLVEEGREKGTL
jgi:hypothetical protein